MALRTVLRGVGKTFITAGVLILLFVAYQLWGTGIAEARAQHNLRHEFDAALRGFVSRHPTTTSSPPTTRPHAFPSTTRLATAPTTSTTELGLPPPPPGGALAILSIPRIGVDAAVVEGVGVDDLKKGPGHYPNSPLPGQPGNTAIAGHRTTYGAPFYHLDAVQPGDDVFLHTAEGPTYHYQVAFQHNVSPSDVSVIDPMADNRLTLTTCTPRFSASQRLIVVARLIGAATAPKTLAPPPVTNPGTGHSTTPPTTIAGADVGSLSGKGESTLPAILWGFACVLVWIGGYLVGRRWRRWPAYLLTTPVFLIVLFVFFENFARLLPANV